jgi:hypothetical protein
MDPSPSALSLPLCSLRIRIEKEQLDQTTAKHNISTNSETEKNETKEIKTQNARQKKKMKHMK